MDYTQLETPCYVINSLEYIKSITELMQTYEKHWGGSVIYGYSVKTNHFPYMLKKAMEYGWMAEVVSPDEYNLAKMCGCTDRQIIYNGPQKRETVLDACRNGAMVNLDHLQEVFFIAEHLTEEEKRRARIGLRVNYDLEAECPGETTCKGVVGRFGISLENGDVEKAIHTLKQSGIVVKGLHMHQSSNSRSLKIYESLSKKAIEVIEKYDLEELEYVDMGGGFFGGSYFPGKPTVEQYAKTICSILKTKLDSSRITLVLEPGAAVLATAMDYLVSVLNIRQIRNQKVVTVDGSVIHINPFMNPHPTPFTMINPGREWDAQVDGEQIIGGSTCMEMDRIYPRNIRHEVQLDSRLLFHCCGAYMSTHNSSFINAAPNIYLKENEKFTLLRRKNCKQMMEF